MTAHVRFGVKRRPKPWPARVSAFTSTVDIMAVDPYGRSPPGAEVRWPAREGPIGAYPGHRRATFASPKADLAFGS